MEIHKSRLLPFVGRPVPEIVRPRYMWAGLSRTQQAIPYVANWISTRQAVNDLIRAFTQFVLSTDLQATLGVGGEDFFDRLNVFTNCRSNFGIMAVNKDTEELSNISVPLGSLDALQAQAQEHIASISRVPLVKLLGISPHGLNASSEGEIRVFYDHILAFQEQFFRPGLERVFRLIQLNLWGRMIPELTFEFEHLWVLDDIQRATVKKLEAETAQILIDTGVISQMEERKAQAADEDTRYAGLDIEELPDLKEEEEQGLEPKGGHPNPLAESDQPDDGKEPDEEQT
jgi:phage-related protein (TIGR01555 family)